MTILVPISTAAYKRCQRLVEAFGLDMRDWSQVMSRSRSWWTTALQNDVLLNNVPQKDWDALGVSLRLAHMSHNVGPTGEETDRYSYPSLTDIVCALKHAVRFQFLRAEPDFDDPVDMLKAARERMRNRALP